MPLKKSNSQNYPTWSTLITSSQVWLIKLPAGVGAVPVWRSRRRLSSNRSTPPTPIGASESHWFLPRHKLVRSAAKSNEPRRCVYRCVEIAGSIDRNPAPTQLQKQTHSQKSGTGGLGMRQVPMVVIVPFEQELFVCTLLRQGWSGNAFNNH